MGMARGTLVLHSYSIRGFFPLEHVLSSSRLIFQIVGCTYHEFVYFINYYREDESDFCLPKMVVSDNDTAFTSSEFQEFMKQNGIIHCRSAPYHPSSNGLAVQSLKEGLNKLIGSIECHLNKLIPILL